MDIFTNLQEKILYLERSQMRRELHLSGIGTTGSLPIVIYPIPS